MVHVILLILKGLGILLLALLLLFLLALAAILLVPVRYRIEASVLEKKPDVSLRVTWLLHLLSVSAEYHPDAGPFAVKIRFLGMELGKEKKGKKGRKKGEQEEKKDDSAVWETEHEAEKQETEESEAWWTEEQEREEFRTDEAEDAERIEDSETAEVPDDADESGASAWEWADAEKHTGSQDTGSAKKGKSFGITFVWKRLQSLVRSVREFFGKLKKGAVNLAEKKEKLTAFMQDEENQKLLHLLWRQAGGVFRHIRPRKLRLYLRFGFEDPYWTGKVLGYASMFYAYYHKNVELVPEFEQEVLEGNLYAKGRVRAGTLMAKGARLLLDKGFRNMLKKVLRRT